MEKEIGLKSMPSEIRITIAIDIIPIPAPIAFIPSTFEFKNDIVFV
jgi:hypothetical protein